MTSGPTRCRNKGDEPTLAAMRSFCVLITRVLLQQPHHRHYRDHQ